MPTSLQQKTAEAIVNIFETDSVRGDYGNVTLIKGDTGHLTFGRSQTTLGSGNLGRLIQNYIATLDARFAKVLTPFVPRFEKPDFSLDTDAYLKNILRASADDVVMRDVQDVFFDKTYWQPAENAATKLGIATALGITVVYDSTVHGSFDFIRDRTNQQFGTLVNLGEKQWIADYVKTRRDWLANNTREDLRATVYRMDALQRLIDLNLWDLPLPLLVRGHEISELTLNAAPTRSYDGPQPGSRALALQTPLVRGLDVRLVQLGLSKVGIDVLADGVFGNGSVLAIKTYQAQHNLPITGTLDAASVIQVVG